MRTSQLVEIFIRKLIPGVAITVALLGAQNAVAVSMDWTVVGAPGEGGVGYEYRISEYEVTNAQYAEFLNAKAKIAGHSGSYRWHPGLGSDTASGGIARTGVGSVIDPYAYTPLPGKANYPVANVSLTDAQHFINWLNNGQGDADTFNGVYNINAELATPFGAPIDIVRSPTATVWLPNRNEWEKAALYDPNKPGGAGDWKYPTSSDTQPGKALPDVGNSANYLNLAVGATTSAVGAYSKSPSPWGTYDQMGNVAEWIEVDPVYQTGGTWYGTNLGGSVRSTQYDYNYNVAFDTAQWDINHGMLGFRVAAVVPEPSSFVLFGMGALGLLAAARRRRRQ